MPKVTVIQPLTVQEENRILRVAAYCRASSDSEDQLNSYMTQVNYYSHLFENSSTETLVDIYADEGITGTCEEKRTEFLRLMEDCRKGKIDRIYIKSISRFARNTRDCLKNIRELKSLGVTVKFEKENIDTADIKDELMITIMGGLAQEESTSISQNLKWSIRRKMKNGSYSPVNAPLGYRLKNKTLVIEESEVKIVRDIFNHYISGCGIKGTVDYINKKYGDTINIPYSSMRYILRNEKYIGDSLLQKYYTPDIIGAGCVPNKGEKDMYYIQNTHQPIISNEIFETAQALMKDRLITKKGPVIYPFTRKLECALCGNHFNRKVCRDKYYWVCNKHDYSASLCNSKKITEESIINAFIKLFNKIYSNYTELLLSIQKSLQELMIKQATGRSDIIEIRRSLLQLKEQLNIIASLRTKGFLNEAKYKEQSAEINNKIAKLNKDLRLLSQSEDTTLKDVEMLIDYFEKREHIMIEFEPQAFEFLIDRIVVKDNILEFHIMGGLIFTEEV